MTPFSSIFKELTKSKARLVRRLAFLQLVVGILLGFWALFNSAFNGESKAYFLFHFLLLRLYLIWHIYFSQVEKMSKFTHRKHGG